jgi:predicted  nucleic acid-binding Zn-ribbon protein
MGNKIIWSLLILLISFAACSKSSKNNVSRQPNLSSTPLVISDIHTIVDKDPKPIKNDEEPQSENDLRILLDTLKKENTALADYNDELISAKRNLMREHQNLIAEKEAISDSRQVVINDLEELTTERDALKTQLTAMREQKPLTMDKDCLHTDLDQANFTIDLQAQEIERLMAENRKFGNVADLKDQLETAQRDLTNCWTNIDAGNKAYRALEDEVAQKTSAIESLNEQLTSIKAHNPAATPEMSQSLSTYKSAIQDSKTEIDRLKHEIRELIDRHKFGIISDRQKARDAYSMIEQSFNDKLETTVQNERATFEEERTEYQTRLNARIRQMEDEIELFKERAILPLPQTLARAAVEQTKEEDQSEDSEINHLKQDLSQQSMVIDSRPEGENISYTDIPIVEYNSAHGASEDDPFISPPIDLSIFPDIEPSHENEDGQDWSHQSFIIDPNSNASPEITTIEPEPEPKPEPEPQPERPAPKPKEEIFQDLIERINRANYQDLTSLVPQVLSLSGKELHDAKCAFTARRRELQLAKSDEPPAPQSISPEAQNLIAKIKTASFIDELMHFRDRTYDLPLEDFETAYGAYSIRRNELTLDLASNQ